MFDPSLAQVTRYGADAFVRLAAKVALAEEIQWDAPQRTRIANDTYSNPTFDIVANEQRLAVREAVERARIALVNAAEAAREANRALDRAIEQYEV